MNLPLDTITNQLPISPCFTLRPYQTKAVNAVLKDLKSVQKVGLIMPTGSGKTEIFIDIASKYLEENPDKCVLILSHMSLLTYQTRERFKLRAPHIKVGTFQGDEFPHRTSQVVIGTMQTSKTTHKTDRLKLRIPKPVGLIIIDEAHYLTCDSYETALAAFPNAYQVGCTATPFRSGALMTNYFDRISFSISIQELIKAGYLVEPKLIQITDDSTEVETKMALIASIYKQTENGKQALIFMKSIEDAKQMRNVLDDHKINARAITSELLGDDREKILDDFRSGKIKVLTTVNVLTAGFDSKNVEVIFMPYPTKSPTTYLQRIGRGLRPDPTINKTECRIYVCGNTPAIKQDLYKKLHNNVLEVNSKKKKATTFEEDFEYAEDFSNEVYVWNRTVCETIRRMKGMGLDRIAGLLNSKKFPQRFLKDITAINRGLEGLSINPSQDPASSSKINMLKSLGFTKDCLANITNSEAQTLLAVALNVKEEWKKRPYTMLSGKFPGKHISELPRPYILLIKNRYPFSQLAKTIKEYEASGGKYLFSV